MHSAMYEGNVFHRRKDPVENLFNFKLFYYYFDLEELDGLLGPRWLFSSKRASVARFNYRQHMAHANVSDCSSLRAAVFDTLREKNINAEIGRVCLLTQLGYFGFVMNPVSFYFCFEPASDRVTAVIAEVNNTPWGEQHLYVIPAKSDVSANVESSQRIVANSVKKDFHVSPFMPLSMTYEFKFDIASDQLRVSIANYENGKNPFYVSMQLERQPITPSRMNWSLLKFPFISGKIFLGIYWQAAKLWWKKVPFHAHPGTSPTVPAETEPHSVEIGNPTKTSSSASSNHLDEEDSVLVNQ